MHVKDIVITLGNIPNCNDDCRHRNVMYLNFLFLLFRQLEERRKKLELMLFQENMQLQQELKNLAAQPKYFKNG